MVKRLLFLLLFSSLSGYSQSWVYHPFPTTTAVWKSNHSSSSGTNDDFKIQMQGDTIIGAYSYKKLYSTLSGFYYYGALRQDIPNKKVYLMDVAGTEILLHDFDLALGDTVKFFPGMSDTMYVSSIDSTLVGSNYHKAFRITSTNLACNPADLIEGVGWTSDFYWFYEYTFENVWELRCFSQDNSARLFPWPGGIYPYECYMTVGISELQEGALSIVPNPVNDIATISVNCGDDYFVEVTGANGQLISRSNLSGSLSQRLDLSTFDSGIYFVRLINAEGKSITKKIIKQ